MEPLIWTGVLPLHADTLGPQPFPTYAQTANINYALTPYSREAGTTAIVPGSYKRARQPTLSEMALSGDQANSEAMPLDMAPGDCAVWHGHTWHGSYERQIPGIRMNLAHYFARHHVTVQERHRGEVPRKCWIVTPTMRGSSVCWASTTPTDGRTKGLMAAR